MSRFNTVLVANRGEIACRILSSARALGYRTVAVYSQADAGAPHVSLADTSVCIGPGPVAESYLSIEKILAAARDTGAQAVHPGYGFLSENAEFARACEAEGLVFIGPTAEAIQLMGNKAESKRHLQSAGVPLVPGYEGEDQSDSTLVSEAERIGLPVMVKAAAGGGGRGMRLVQRKRDLEGAIALARSEAQSAFGSDELILEKAIARPRHVEIQVFADQAGHTIHLGERDCSVQRRHQKVIEEAPCPVMTPKLRSAMGDAAVAAARSIDYRGAGTVEFLLDESGAFYFLEMNTRLQVEHPVTELVTGLDLVALQLQVAQGEPLGLEQGDIELTGHAIEVRLYTEDPGQDFLPTAGPVALWVAPAGPGIRVDDGISTGQELSPYYDAMVAKIVAHGPTRDIARRRLIDALQHTVLFGPTSNRAFLIDCLQNDTFTAGEATTAFIGEEFKAEALQEAAPTFVDSAAAAVVECFLACDLAMAASVLVADELRGWSSTVPRIARRQYRHGATVHDLSIEPRGDNRYRVAMGEGEDTCDIGIDRIEENRAELNIDGKPCKVVFLHAGPGQLYLCIDGRSSRYDDLIRLDGSAVSARSSGEVTAPMHGLLLEVRVAEGDSVAPGQTLAVLEAMKMHHEIRAEADGEIVALHAQAGTQVSADDLLLEISVRETAAADDSGG